MLNRVSKEELQKLSHKNQVRFALFCAKAVSHLNPNHEAQLAIRTVELWLDNKATVEECKKAADAGYAGAYAAADATDYASYAGAHAAYAGAAAADAAAYAADAAYAAYAANIYAARAAGAAAAYAGAHAAAAKNKAIQVQREYYDELLYIDEIFEKVALGYT